MPYGFEAHQKCLICVHFQLEVHATIFIITKYYFIHNCSLKYHSKEYQNVSSLNEGIK